MRLASSSAQWSCTISVELKMQFFFLNPGVSQVTSMYSVAL